MTELDTAAARLLEATRTGVACAPVRDLVGTDLAAAYAVQQQLTMARRAGGATVTGRKIGLTSPAVQRQLGVDQPDFGVLFDDMGFADGAVVPIARFLQPRVEAEIAFVLGADLDDGPLDVRHISDAVEYAIAAIEVCDSRVAGWDISLVDTVADNASAGAYVLGTVRRALGDFVPAEVAMRLTLDGAEASTGSGAACLGDPLNALVWLARTAREFGDPLRAGQVVLSGALGPMVGVTGGSRVVAEISGLGAVSVDFAGT